MRVVTARQMKEIERRSLAYDMSYARLMENAGSAAAAFIRRTFQRVEGLNCIVFCGGGNNGGDGLVVARKLREHQANVVIVLVDGMPASEEARSMYTMAEIMEIPILSIRDHCEKIVECLPRADILVDGVYGTGFHGELEGGAAQACGMINEAIAAVVALDIPSGAECDTGRLARGGVMADFTVAFDSLKPVHVLPGSQAACGVVEVVDIGIPGEAREGVEALEEEAEAVSSAPPPPVEPPSAFVAPSVLEPVPAVDTAPLLDNPPIPEAVPASAPPPRPAHILRDIETAEVFSHLPVRDPYSHKGSHGFLLAVCGSSRYRGAAVLAVTASLRSGVGIGCLASTETVCSTLAGQLPEATFLPLPQNGEGGISYSAAETLLPRLVESGAALFGPGLGNTGDTARLLDYVLDRASCPLVLDADGINALAGNINRTKDTRASLILTPHPGEMARLTGLSIAEVEADREGIAVRFSREWNAVVLLKGHETLIASPQGQLYRNRTGNAGLAKGGSGDVLAGIIASFAAQGVEPLWAAVCGAHLHGLAADRTAARLSQYAMLPSDILQDLAGLFLEYGR